VLCSVAIDSDTAAVPPPPLTPFRAPPTSPARTEATYAFLVSSRSSRTLPLQLICFQTSY
jgi:hypothetical protein